MKTMPKPTHGGSRPVKRKDDGRLNRTMQYAKQILILDCTIKELKQIRRAFSTRQRARVLLKKINN